MLKWLKNVISSPVVKTDKPAAVIEYLLNDPLTPNLKASIQVPFLTDLPRFYVRGWNGYAVSDIQKQAAQVYACLTATMNMVKGVYPRTIHWSVAEALVVNPRAGRGANAFYDRVSLNFLFEEHPTTKKMVFTSESVNVVAHELGHAILDAIRPDLWNVQSLEIFAFHEAFGDIVSMLCTLQNDIVIDYMLTETNNNPRTSNIVSRIAEEMGNLIHSQGKKNVEINALRNAANTFVYVQPETLPRTVEDLSLSQEPHNYSRIFSGIWFDCLVSIYEHEKAQISPREAMKKARDIMAYVIVNSLPGAAATPRFFTAIAKSMLGVVQARYGNLYFGILRRVFLKRKVINGTLMTGLARKTMDLHNVDLTKIHNLQDMCCIRTGEVLESRLLDLESRKFKFTNLPLDLLNVRLEIPMEQQYTLDSANRVIDELSTDKSYVNEAVKDAVKFLHHSKQIGTDHMSQDKCFCITNGKLVRQRSCCLK